MTEAAQQALRWGKVCQFMDHKSSRLTIFSGGQWSCSVQPPGLHLLATQVRKSLNQSNLDVQC